MNTKLLQSSIKTEAIYTKIYDSKTSDYLTRYEIAFSELRANPTEKDLQEVRDYLVKKNCREFTANEIKQAFDLILSLTLLAIEQGITQDRAKNRQKIIRRWKKDARIKDERVLTTKPFERIICSVCTSLMYYKWSTLFESIKLKSQVLFFYECPNCHKRDAIFEDGQIWVPQSISSCPICNGKRVTTVTQDKTGKSFIIYECTKCSSKQVETGPELSVDL